MLKNIRVLFILFFLLVGSAVFGTTCHLIFTERSSPQLNKFNVFAVYTNNDYTKKDDLANDYIISDITGNSKITTDAGEVEVNIYDTSGDPSDNEHKLFYFYAGGKKVDVFHSDHGCISSTSSGYDNAYVDQGYLKRDLLNVYKCQVNFDGQLDIPTYSSKNKELSFSVDLKSNLNYLTFSDGITKPYVPDWIKEKYYYMNTKVTATLIRIVDGDEIPVESKVRDDVLMKESDKIETLDFDFDISDMPSGKYKVRVTTDPNIEPKCPDSESKILNSNDFYIFTDNDEDLDTDGDGIDDWCPEEKGDNKYNGCQRLIL